jgi:hypothetical protein
MSDDRDDNDEFATSLLSLTLTRNGYSTQKDVRFPKGVADIVARKSYPNGKTDSFVVEVKWAASEQNIDKISAQKRAVLATASGVPVYVAWVIGNGKKVFVDPDLRGKMRYSTEEMQVADLRAGQKRVLSRPSSRRHP